MNIFIAKRINYKYFWYVIFEERKKDMIQLNKEKKQNLKKLEQFV